MSKDLEILNNDDVISVIESYKNRFRCGNTLLVEQLYNECISNHKDIFEQYIDCKVLRESSNHKGWRKGKIKFILQFEPDLVESNERSNSLDDIRKQLDTTT